MHCGAVLCIVNHILTGFERQSKILTVIVKWTDFQRVNTNMHRADHSVPTRKETGVQRQEEVSKNYLLFCTEEIETTTSCALRGHKLKETKNQDLARGWQTALFPIEVESVSGPKWLNKAFVEPWQQRSWWELSGKIILQVKANLGLAASTKACRLRGWRCWTWGEVTDIICYAV